MHNLPIRVHVCKFAGKYDSLLESHAFFIEYFQHALSRRELRIVNLCASREGRAFESNYVFTVQLSSIESEVFRSHQR